MPPRRVQPPTLVLLVRHGRIPTTGEVLPGRTPQLHLSHEGRAQAEAAAARIAELKKLPSAVYASPLERCMETAKPIASKLGLRVRSERGLLECDFGDWTGEELKKLRRLRDWQRVVHQPSSFRFPGGESFAEMQARALGAIDRLCERHRGETVVAVSHADPIKAVVAGVAGIPLDLFQRLVVSPCSVTVLSRSPTSSHLLALNTTTCLSELALS